MNEELVLIARVRKPHGIKGEVSVQSFTFDETRFKKLKRVFLRNPKGEISGRILKSVRILPAGTLFTFEGIDDRNSAELLRDSDILIPESERSKLPKGRFYYDEIIGIDVIDDATGNRLGTIKNVLDMPGADIFVLDLNGAEHLLTNRGEEIKKIDLAKKEIRVTLLETYGT